MVIARKYLVDEDRSGCYHLISRCVRRAFLCGDGYEHRKDWIEERLQQLNEIFAIDIMAFAVMSNHLHLAVKTQPQLAEQWSAQEVVERWLTLYPRAEDDEGKPCLPPFFVIESLMNNEDWVTEHRQRLASLSWFMKCLKQPIARRANAEDGCRGHFWESRFQSVALLDQTAVVACMAYIDLNPIRAAIADTPENSEHTSIRLRIQEWKARQQHIADDLHKRQQQHRLVAEHRWLSCIGDCHVGDKDDLDAPRPLTLSAYIDLVDQTGRFLAAGKRGHIDHQLAPALERLRVSSQGWIETMCSGAQFTGTAVGSAVRRSQEAIRRGVRCIFNRCALYHDSAPPD